MLANRLAIACILQFPQSTGVLNISRAWYIRSQVGRRWREGKKALKGLSERSKVGAVTATVT